jgi:hypothetical protein
MDDVEYLARGCQSLCDGHDGLMRRLRLLGLVPLALLLGLGVATAQDLSCPSGPQVQTYSGTVMVGETTPPIFVEHRPCEMFSMDISITIAQRNGSVTVRVYDGLSYPQDQPSNYEMISCGQPFKYSPSTCGATWPKAASVTGQPFLGTRGESRAKSVTINYCCGYSGIQISYLLTVTRTPRPGFNLGGTSTSDAPLQVTPAGIKASVHPYDSQYWKVQLPHGGTLKVMGRVRAITTISPAANLNIRVYNAAGNYSMIKAVNSIPGGSVWVPFESSTYTNTTGQTAFFWVAAVAVGRLVDLDMTIVQDNVLPQLSLFLDADENFDPNQPTSDWEQFVPGSRLMNAVESPGDSLTLPPCGSPIQRIRVLAAYVDANGMIVPPPVAGLTMSVTNPSALEGMAGNIPDPRDVAGGPFADDLTLDDFADFASSPIPNTAIATVAVWDYAAFGTVTANPATGTQMALMLPKDTMGNWIPAIGWMADAVQVPNNVVGQSDDTDGTPSAAPPPADGLTGDGLTRFEEYRGFSVQGKHTRTDPRVKDVFIAAKLNQGTVFGIGFASNLPVKARHIWGEEDLGRPLEYYPIDLSLPPTQQPHYRQVNFNAGNSSAGGPPLGHQPQKALLVRNQTINGQGIVGDTKSLSFAPSYCPPTGGHYPNSLPEVLVDLAKLQVVGTNYGNTQVQIDNEVRRTIAHEIGHALHIQHRGDAIVCGDGAAVGTQYSVMSSGWFNGAVSNGLDGYNSDDRVQIRVSLP